MMMRYEGSLELKVTFLVIKIEVLIDIDIDAINGSIS